MLLIDAQARHLLYERLLVKVLPLSCLDQRRGGLHPGIEILGIEGTMRQASVSPGAKREHHMTQTVS
jgi:hypothetical protein